MGPAGAAGDREGGKGGAAGAGSSAGAAGKDGGSGGPRREARTRPEVLMVAPTLRAEPQAKQPPERAALARAPEPIQRVPRASAAIAARLHHGRMRVSARRHAKPARPAAGSRAFITSAQSRCSAPPGNDPRCASFRRVSSSTRSEQAFYHQVDRLIVRRGCPPERYARNAENAQSNAAEAGGQRRDAGGRAPAEGSRAKAACAALSWRWALD